MARWILEKANGTREQVGHCLALAWFNGLVRQRPVTRVERLPHQRHAKLVVPKSSCFPYANLDFFEGLKDDCIVVALIYVGRTFLARTGARTIA